MLYFFSKFFTILNLLFQFMHLDCIQTTDIEILNNLTGSQNHFDLLPDEDLRKFFSIEDIIYILTASVSTYHTFEAAIKILQFNPNLIEKIENHYKKIIGSLIATSKITFNFV